MLAVEEPDLVVVEGYAFSRPNQAHQLGEMGGVVRLACWSTTRPTLELQPNVRAKWATGNGGAGKPEVLAAAVRELGYGGHSTDEADALWLLDIAHHGYTTTSRRTPPSPKIGRARAEVLEAVDWPTVNGRRPAFDALPKLTARERRELS